MAAVSRPEFAKISAYLPGRGEHSTTRCNKAATKEGHEHHHRHVRALRQLLREKRIRLANGSSVLMLTYMYAIHRLQHLQLKSTRKFPQPHLLELCYILEHSHFLHLSSRPNAQLSLATLLNLTLGSTSAKLGPRPGLAGPDSASPASQKRYQKQSSKRRDPALEKL